MTYPTLYHMAEGTTGWGYLPSYTLVVRHGGTPALTHTHGVIHARTANCGAHNGPVGLYSTGWGTSEVNTSSTGWGYLGG